MGQHRAISHTKLHRTLTRILNALSFVDKIVFGRLNYNRQVSKFKGYQDFYNTQAQIVVEFCQIHNLDFHIKKGTVRDASINATTEQHPVTHQGHQVDPKRSDAAKRAWVTIRAKKQHRTG